MASRTRASKRKIKENYHIVNDLPDQKANKLTKKDDFDGEELPDIDLPEVDIPQIDFPVASKPRKVNKAKNASLLASKKSDSVGIDPVATIKPKFKTKASQAEYLSSKLEALKCVFKEKVSNSFETIGKIQIILDDLSSHNNKASMFLDNKW